MIRRPDNWKPNCICDSQASEPNDKCPFHGYPDTRVCPFCGAFMNPIKPCTRCGFLWEKT